MTITTTKLTRAAGVAGVAGGLLFIAVQVKHPNLDLAFVSATEWKVRETMKVLFAALSLAGITAMYLRQLKKTGVLGVLGYVPVQRRLSDHDEHRARGCGWSCRAS